LGNRKVIYDFGNKKIYEGDTETHLIQSFTDTIVSRNGKKTGRLKGKGRLNNAISAYLFEYLQSYNVSTHFTEKISENEMKVIRTEPIPVDVIVRNIAAGPVARQFGLKDPSDLESPFIEYYYNADFVKYPQINESHIYALNLAESDDMRNISMEITKSNAVLKPLFERRDIKLAEFIIRFGIFEGKVMITGEFNPDTCHLRDSVTNAILDCDRYIKDGASTVKIYQEVHDRLIGMG
jgi:phosphoribosylaminoimidazole-succinocarboxamide synthase